MYIRRKVFSCVEERSFAEEQKDGKKKWSPVDEEFVRMSNEVDKDVERRRKLGGALFGASVGMVPAALAESLSDNAFVRKKPYALLSAAAVAAGGYAGWKAGKKYHEKKSGLKDDIERYEQLSPRDREKYRQMKGVLW